MKWKHPPIIKIYEALGSVADGRIIVEGNTAKVHSSSGNKYYDVLYDPDVNAIMTNDNGSYFKGYLGYPAIAYLLSVSVLPYEKDCADLLKGIPWKDINQEFKNDFDKTLTWIEERLSENQRRTLSEYVVSLDEKIRHLSLDMLGKKIKPPTGY